MRMIGSRPPFELTAPLRDAWHFLRALGYAGNGRYCPVCKRRSRRFGRAGARPRDDAMCMRCGSLERHRLVWLYFLRKTDLFDGRPKRMLHVAPESCFERRLRKRLGQGYLSADLRDPAAMAAMDIMDIQCPDGYFDVIYCSHVLEHVTDDRRAMRELHRVLHPRGWAVLLVPILAERTFEDPAILDPLDRLRVYGNADHARIYGPDYVDRLREAGFQVTTTRIADLAGDEEAIRMGLTRAGGDIFTCTK